MRFRLVPKSSTLDDLELLQVHKIFSEFCATSHVCEATTAKRMKLGRYFQRRNCCCTESAFQGCIDDVDIAQRSYVRGDFVSCVRYTDAVARLPFHQLGYLVFSCSRVAEMYCAVRMERREACHVTNTIPHCATSPQRTKQTKRSCYTSDCVWSKT